MSVLHLVKTPWISFHVVPNIAYVLLINITAYIFLCKAYLITVIPRLTSGPANEFFG